MKETNYVFIDLLKRNENKREGESLPRNKEINKKWKESTQENRQEKN